MCQGRQVTTRAVLAEETRIVDFAEGRGAVRPLGRPLADRNEHLPPSPERQGRNATRRDLLVPLPGGKVAEVLAEQYAVARHVWDSPDQGDPDPRRGGHRQSAHHEGDTRRHRGTGGHPRPDRRRLAQYADDGLKMRIPWLRSSSTASGEQIKGGVIYVDEAGVTPHQRPVRPLRNRQTAARKLHPPATHKTKRPSQRQHVPGAPAGPGLEVAELRNMRQRQYEQAVAAIEAGDILKGHDIFAELGWVEQVSDNFSRAGRGLPGGAGRAERRTSRTGDGDPGPDPR